MDDVFGHRQFPKNVAQEESAMTTENEAVEAKPVEIKVQDGQIVISGGEELSLEQAHKVLAAKYQEEEGDVRVNEPVKCFPLDGATALFDVVRETFGWTSLEPTPGFFGSRPPELLGVEVNYNETRQIPWGRMSLPGMAGYLEAGVTRSTLGPLGVPYRRSHQAKR